MATRELSRPPRVLPLYLRAAAPLVPGASKLPFVPGGGREMPELELRIADAKADPRALAEYAAACGFGLPGTLPATYPHVLAFPLHMALMADGRFPFGAVGLVHVANRIVQHRPIRSDERLELRVRLTPLEAHSRGRTFSIASEARADGELVWEELTTVLRRDGTSGTAGESAVAREEHEDGQGPEPVKEAEWRLPGDLGRRYGGASGDRNPIHLHPLTAKALGFPRAIAHGMWTKARCLAALEERLPPAFGVEVRFRKPILLPADVAFATAADGGSVRFAVADAAKGTPHLDGSVEPLPQERS